MARTLRLVLVIAFAASCGPLVKFQSEERAYFLLSDDGTLPNEAIKPNGLRLVVRDLTASSFIDSHKIIFSEDPSRQAFYQFAQWVEPPTDRITVLAVERLERSGAFSSVARLSSSLLGDVQLNGEILDFYHDISGGGKGVVRVRIDFELVNIRDRVIVQKKEIIKSVPVNKYNAEGAVEAFSIAVNEALNELVSWAGASADKIAPAAAGETALLLLDAG